MGHTAVSHVKLVNGNRVFGIYDEGVMKDFVLTPADIAFICEHDCVVAAFWSRAEKYLGEIKSKGIPIAFDFADMWGEMLIEEIAQNVDYAFFSYNDIDTVEDFLRDIKMSGFNKLIIATMGVNGSIAYDGEKYYYQSAVTVPVVEDYGKNKAYYQELKAFKEGNVYMHLPYNYYYTNIDVALADAYYMGSIIYPKAFDGVDAKEKFNEITKFLLGAKL